MRKLIALLVLLLPFAVHAGTVTLTYVPPTTCEDGSALSNCPTTAFEILESTSATGTMTTRETVGATITSRTYANLAPGARCYAVKTVSNSVKSAESTRACVDVPSLPPKAPAGISVRIEVTVTP
jgi:hypothetical protein